MALYPQDLETNPDRFCAEIVHAVRSVLAAWDVYHAPWVIMATLPGVREVRIEAFWDPKNHFPDNVTVSLDSTYFSQNTSHDIDDLTDINILGLARALRNRMQRLTTSRSK